MKDERKAITVRVSPELKFQIDKAANKDNRTINSWIINVIKQHLEEGAKKNKGATHNCATPYYYTGIFNTIPGLILVLVIPFASIISGYLLLLPSNFFAIFPSLSLATTV